MTSSEFYEIAREAIKKHQMKRKAFLFGITAWIAMITGIELVIWWPPSYISSPLLATCFIAFIAFGIILIRQLLNIAEQARFDREMERRKRKSELDKY